MALGLGSFPVPHSLLGTRSSVSADRIRGLRILCSAVTGGGLSWKLVDSCPAVAVSAPSAL